MLHALTEPDLLKERSRSQIVEELGEQLRQLRQTRRIQGPGRISSGSPALDRLLPEGGLARGTLAEWFGSGPGSGATMLALLAAREACRRGGPLVVIDRRRMFYPPAAIAWGIDPQSLIILRPAHERDEQWALDQVLRSSHVAAVLCWPARLDAHAFRRMQLAVETSGGLGLLVRPAAERTAPSWAEVRWLVSPHPSQGAWRLRVELLRCRGGQSRSALELEVDEQNVSEVAGVIHEANPVHLAPRLAAATIAQQSASA